ncbi:hypothetical protein PBCV1_a451L [Paramecium bursaria Chlorella virus 1]|uniref:Uncharacterized protein n=1 Tax=Paramecium bursaria Chlorella virus 1 TaxID=10506 RepID=Q98502_PBCV1|nr:hypothetical protein PBCV1_a451L [Paramecium bursaria Chlorella virus 1]AAC96819.1 hypothetical protein [Paramecium bursaria Chlorella virus 1]
MPREILCFKVFYELFCKLGLYYICISFEGTRSIVYKLLRVLVQWRFLQFTPRIFFVNFIVFHVNHLFSIGSDNTSPLRVPKYQRGDIFRLKFPVQLSLKLL